MSGHRHRHGDDKQDVTVVRDSAPEVPLAHDGNPRKPSALAPSVLAPSLPRNTAAAVLPPEVYLIGCGGDHGSRCAAKVFREAKVREREKQLAKRFGVAKWKDDPEDDDPNAYSLAMSAIQAP